MINKLAIIGVGLIGGSLALALRQARYVRKVVGTGRGLQNLQQAVSLGIIDEVAVNARAAVAGADMVVVAVPVESIGSVLADMASALETDAVVTDVGSVKGNVIAAARAALGARFANFVAGHPIAGTEKSGAAAALPDLFQNRRVILTPATETNADAVQRVAGMWRMAGADPVTMDAQAHDEVFAATSHLPHLLAYTLVGLLNQTKLPGLGENRTVFDFAAGGFRDFSRIASSDPVMWRDICLANRDAIIKNLQAYRAALADLVAVIERGDGDNLLKRFAAAKQARDNYIDKKSES